mgnify:CR=1 FL=1
MTREELINLGNKITNWSGSEEELLELMNIFNKNVPHPNGPNLFSYPENYNARRDDEKEYNPTVEEVVDKCLNYQPIVLSPPKEDE